MIVTTVVLTNAAQAKCFHSQCRSRMYAVTHQILNLNCILSLEPNGDQWNFGKQHQQGPQNSYPISARGLEGFNTLLQAVATPIKLMTSTIMNNLMQSLVLPIIATSRQLKQNRSTFRHGMLM